MRHLRILALGCAGLCAAVLPYGSALAEQQPAAAEPGVWQKHEYSFEFMGFTSTYSCDGLADKLQRLLILSGARADAKAEPGACAAPYGRPDRFARAKIIFYTLAPAGTVGEEPGQGRWRPVSLAAHTPIDLQTGDCELVEQFRDEVLKKMFTIRNLVDGTRCIPHQESGSNIDLRFDTFAGDAGPGAPKVIPVVPPRVFVYPRKGQNADQQARDRRECQASAASESGFDPAAPANGDQRSKSDAYSAAYAACLEARGYSVR